MILLPYMITGAGLCVIYDLIINTIIDVIVYNFTALQLREDTYFIGDLTKEEYIVLFAEL